jgi:hypothetical protein
MVDNNMDYLSIIGCKCYKGTAAAKPGYGIRINNANNDYVALFDCDLQDGGSTAANSDAGTSTNKQGGR